jgi:hypothetical protein
MTKQVDVFAEIAAAGGSGHGDLEPLPVPPRPERILPVGDSPTDAARFEPVRRSANAEDLASELAAIRARYEPFLQNLAPKPEEMRQRLALEHFQWRLETAEDRADAGVPLAGGGAWEQVRIPHFGGPIGRATAYYRTEFDLGPGVPEDRTVFARFNGVDYKAHVFVNGSHIGSHEGLFAPFEFECTKHARPGRNVLLVKVENDAICNGNTAWTWHQGGEEFEGDKIYAATGPGYDDPLVGWHHCPPGMGIYQTVCIEVRARQFIHDIFVRPLPDGDRAEAWIEVWNTEIHNRPAAIHLSLHGQNFQETVFDDRPFEAPPTLGPGVNYLRLRMEIPGHRRWEPDSPWLYQLQARLTCPDGTTLDTATRQFGMRTFTMDTSGDPRGRMRLNGREIRLRGANTMGFEQLAVMAADWDRLIDDILLAKLCNMNFWRLTQRPVQREVYDFCDRLGLMTQTDLPLFGVLRRNQFSEAVRQAGEMEKLVRSHPCNILVSYINERFPNARDKPHRHLMRDEIESFFLAADTAVRLENPDRVIKPVDGDYDPPAPGLPDNHCYCGWYNGHGVDLGLLHRGHWLRVKPGWMVGCGEFGSEGLDFADLMRRRYPPEWLPQTREAERTWSPNSIIKAQTGNFHYMWFDTQDSIEGWVAASQAHQAWITRLMTGAFRRNGRMNSIAIHLFIDAFPSGWMKALMDVERRPKPAFFAYRDALTPLMVGLRSDRHAFFSGEPAGFEAWICNDTHNIPEGASIAYRLDLGGKCLAGGQTPARIPSCDSLCQGLVRFDLPAVTARTTATVRLALLDGNGSTLDDSAITIEIFPRPIASPASIGLAGPDNGPAASLLRDLGLEPTPWSPDTPHATRVVICDNPAALTQYHDTLHEAVRNGLHVVLLEFPTGEYHIGPSTVSISPCGMNPVHFASRATGHPTVKDFLPDDFKFWFDPAADSVTPILETTFAAENWTPILTTGKGRWRQPWAPALAAAELPEGKGSWRLCNLRLASRTHHNPTARLFALNLLHQSHNVA